MQLESFTSTPLTKVVPTYLYQQYFDDETLQAFIAALNGQTQGYLDWFNQTPLSVYTNAGVSGPLLDWVGLGLYGVSRPVISSGSTRSVAGYANGPYAGRFPYLSRKSMNNESAFLANDDLYKRFLTWVTYLGDSRITSIHWLRRRVARFLYGFGGADVPTDVFSRVSIIQPPVSSSAPYATGAYANQPYLVRKSRRTPAAHALKIIIPQTSVSTAFQSLIEQGLLPLPFQVRFSVLITG